MAIKQTDNYTLTIGYSSTIPDLKCYQIINKKYGVIEAETFVLPSALNGIDDLEAGLAAAQDMAEDLR